MTKIFTQNDVLRYIYNETSEDENIEIEKALLIQVPLRDFYSDMIEVKLQLDKLEVVAPQRVVNKILEYSKSYHLQFFQE